MDSIEYEALRRVREMQRGQGQNQNRSQSAPQPRNSPQGESEHTPQPAQKTSDSPQAQSASPVQSQPAQTQNNVLLGTLFEDKEKLLILALILILSGEDSQDPALILALLYLII